MLWIKKTINNAPESYQNGNEKFLHMSIIKKPSASAGGTDSKLSETDERSNISDNASGSRALNSAPDSEVLNEL